MIILLYTRVTKLVVRQTHDVFWAVQFILHLYGPTFFIGQNLKTMDAV